MLKNNPPVAGYDMLSFPPHATLTKATGQPKHLENYIFLESVNKKPKILFVWYSVDGSTQKFAAKQIYNRTPTLFDRKCLVSENIFPWHLRTVYLGNNGFSYHFEKINTKKDNKYLFYPAWKMYLHGQLTLHGQFWWSFWFVSTHSMRHS